MLNRLNEAYSGKNSVPEWTFYDYNYTVSSAKNDTKADVEYWKTHLNDMPEQLILPTDEPRPSKFDYKGDEVEYDMSANDTLQLEKFSREKGVSEFALFMAAYGLLLGKVASRAESPDAQVSGEQPIYSTSSLGGVLFKLGVYGLLPSS